MFNVACKSAKNTFEKHGVYLLTIVYAAYNFHIPMLDFGLSAEETSTNDP